MLSFQLVGHVLGSRVPKRLETVLGARERHGERVRCSEPVRSGTQRIHQALADCRTLTDAMRIKSCQISEPAADGTQFTIPARPELVHMQCAHSP
jgi:hypothetical protein